jgi:hypothetical protein
MSVGVSQSWDNPAFDGLFEFCALSAGGTVGAYPSLFVILEYRKIGA